MRSLFALELEAVCGPRTSAANRNVARGRRSPSLNKMYHCLCVCGVVFGVVLYCVLSYVVLLCFVSCCVAVHRGVLCCVVSCCVALCCVAMRGAVLWCGA
eukprot:6130257-Alexandrium_andersonii.AAC.1